MNKYAALAGAINSFKETASDAYGRIVPDLRVDGEGNVAGFSDLANIMLNDGYIKLQNEFVSNLINRIGLTFIQATTGQNRLAMFKKGALPYGSDVQIIFTNPAERNDLGAVNDAGMARLLKTYTPDTKQVVLRTNRGADGLGDVYAVTIATDDIRRAFVSIEALDEYISGLVRTLTARDEIDEFEYTKSLIDVAVAQNQVQITYIDTDITTEQSLKTFLAELRKDFLRFTFPSTLNNAYTNFPDSNGNPCIVTSAESDIALVIKSDVLANVDVNVLAAAFNMEKADFLGRVVPVDTFENPGIVAVLCDQSWLQIRDSLKAMEDFRNAATGSTNTFLRARGVFGILPFANARAYVIDDPIFKPSIPATAILPQTTTAAVGDTVNYRLNPANSTDIIEVSASATATATIDNVSKTVTVTGAGTLDLNIVGNAAVSTTITVS